MISSLDGFRRPRFAPDLGRSEYSLGIAGIIPWFSSIHSGGVRLYCDANRMVSGVFSLATPMRYALGDLWLFTLEESRRT